MRRSVYFYLCWLALLLNGCYHTTSENFTNFPTYQAISLAPSEIFPLLDRDLARISRAHPFKGSGTSCAVPAATFYFTNLDSPYAIDVRAPYGGVVLDINTCVTENAQDGYKIGLGFASSDSKIVELIYHISPMHGRPCSEEGNPTFFDDYVTVLSGQEISAGETIAKVYKSNSGNDNAFLKMYLKISGEPSQYCPNIFSQTVADSFGSHYGTETCSGTAFGSNTFCYQPNVGETLSTTSRNE